MEVTNTLAYYTVVLRATEAKVYGAGPGNNKLLLHLNFA
jgi:hypothetical protein